MEVTVPLSEKQVTTVPVQLVLPVQIVPTLIIAYLTIVLTMEPVLMGLGMLRVYAPLIPYHHTALDPMTGI